MLETRKKIFGEKVYPWILVLLPVLSQYPVGPVDLDVVAMVAFFMCSLIFRRYIRISPLGRNILWLMGYLLAITGINILVGEKFSPAADIIVRTGRYCLYLLIVFFIGNECISFETLMKAYRAVAYAATIYVIIQTLFFYGAGITLPSKLGGSSRVNNADVGRLRSFYSEPAVMSYSLVPFVVCSLFGKQDDSQQKSSSFGAVFVSCGIILSTSGQGILTIAVVWGFWIAQQLRSGTFKAKNFLLLIGILGAAVILYMSGILEFALERTGNTGEGSAANARMSGYQSIALQGPLQRIFGAGFGNYVVENTYGLDMLYQFVNYSSVAEFLFTLGIVGTAFWLLFFTGLFRKGSRCSRMLLLAMLILSLGGCPMTGLQFPLWLTLICTQLPDGQFARRKLPEQSS